MCLIESQGGVKETLDDLAFRNKQPTSHNLETHIASDTATSAGLVTLVYKVWGGSPGGHLLGRLDMSVRSVQKSHYCVNRSLGRGRNPCVRLIRPMLLQHKLSATTICSGFVDEL